MSGGPPHAWDASGFYPICNHTRITAPSLTICGGVTVGHGTKPQAHDQVFTDYRMSIDTNGGIITMHMGNAVDGHMQHVGYWCINTLDAAVRAALIKLGWTPPQDGPRP